ncbi:MAG: preprotein translocase subunit YajC [Clostridia bacterium]|nr:preprotein translocase subunit YajC [Clostridia bacterium]MBQ3231868.1 preprotein translocase subunit YajC [Clostridia bacterium]MBQ4618675.1 preprotein translocase subunit YajC [Clostridia bacterium]
MLDFVSLSTLLDASAAAGEQASPAGSLISMIFPLVLMVVIFYFFLMRPQKKKDKAVKDMLASLKVGDRILTIGGIYGTITGLRDDQVIIAVGAQKTTMHMARWAIKSVEDAPLENDAEPEV